MDDILLAAQEHIFETQKKNFKGGTSLQERCWVLRRNREKFW